MKLLSVKSTTVCVKGATPCWEQDFMFDIAEPPYRSGAAEPGLLVELWNKGVIWDTIIGYVWVPLDKIAGFDLMMQAFNRGVNPNQHNKTNGTSGGTWFNIDAELSLGPDGTDVKGTKLTTGHKIFLDSHFESALEGQSF